MELILSMGLAKMADEDVVLSLVKEAIFSRTTLKWLKMSKLNLFDKGRSVQRFVRSNFTLNDYC